MDQLHILNSLSSRIALVCRASLPSLANNDLSVFALVGIDTKSVIIRNGQLGVRKQTKSEVERCIQSVPGFVLPAR
jgi:hypothetical protein